MKKLIPTPAHLWLPLALCLCTASSAIASPVNYNDADAIKKFVSYTVSAAATVSRTAEEKAIAARTARQAEMRILWMPRLIGDLQHIESHRGAIRIY